MCVHLENGWEKIEEYLFRRKDWL